MVVPVVALLGGCGRFGFDAIGGPDASDASGDGTRASYSALVMADQPRAYYRLAETGSPTTFRDSAGANDALVDIDGGLIDLARPGALARDPDTAIGFAAEGNLGGPRISAWGRIVEVWATWAGDFTIELFVRPITRSPAGYSQSIFVCEDYLTSGFRTGFDADGHPQIWTDQGGALGDLETTIAIPLGEWHHVAFVKRGTSAEIFVDAVLDASDPMFDYLVPTSTAEVGFGAFHGMPADAELDELAIYDVALTPAQIAAHVAASR
jgi:hypothetical protein